MGGGENSIYGWLHGQGREKYDYHKHDRGMLKGGFGKRHAKRGFEENPLRPQAFERRLFQGCAPHPNSHPLHQPPYQFH